MVSNQWSWLIEHLSTAVCKLSRKLFTSLSICEINPESIYNKPNVNCLLFRCTHVAPFHLFPFEFECNFILAVLCNTQSTDYMEQIHSTEQWTLISLVFFLSLFLSSSFCFGNKTNFLCACTLLCAKNGNRKSHQQQ